jgi:hypothetical protein
MKRTLLTALLLSVVCSASRGVIMSFVDSPQDDVKVLGGSHPELQPLLAEYINLLAVRIFPLQNLTNIVAFFGPSLDRKPDDRARPLFSPMMIGESGITPGDVPDKRHIEFYRIGDLGYLEVHYGYDGMWVAACAIHFRTDKEFVPIKAAADFAKRGEWDRTKFEALKQWLDAHLAKITNLGVVEVSESSARRLVLSTNSACIITTRILHHPSVTNLWFTIDLAKDTSDSVERQKSMQPKSIDRPDQSVGFSIDGRFYSLTPKLVQQPAEPNR